MRKSIKSAYKIRKKNEDFCDLELKIGLYSILVLSLVPCSNFGITLHSLPNFTHAKFYRSCKRLLFSPAFAGCKPKPQVFILF